MSTRILALPSRARNTARDTTVGEITRARVKNTRRTLVQWCLFRLQRCSRPYLPTNDRAATTRTRKRCAPMRARLKRGRTCTDTALLLVWPADALYSVWINGWTTRLNDPSAAVCTVETVCT